MQAVLNRFLPALQALPGEISVYAKDLETGETCAFQPDLPLVAASVIKLPILVEAFRREKAGELSMDEVFTIRPEMKVPSCGALTYLHDGLQVTLLDLCVLMIILSDNTATNMLIKRLGIEEVNAAMRSLGLEKTTLRRRLFDSEASRRGIQNHITAGEMGMLLELLYRGKCVSEKADAKMLSILQDQRLNGKIPFFLGEYEIAHKTGEDDGTTHGVGIVYARHPIILCFASNHTDVPAFERIDTRANPLSSLTKMLINTFSMLSGMFTNPSVSPSSTLYSFIVFLSRTTYATPYGVIFIRFCRLCPCNLNLLSLNLLYRLSNITKYTKGCKW